jgi:V-type H+-transporting ATPase subunit a
LGNERSGAQIPSIMNPVDAKEEPPTYFKINKFTASFQGMVDSYGIARYREINPAVFAIITFPWEFGIMFGDVGHGIILLLVALAFIYKERDWEGKKINEIVELLYSGRYLMLLMSIFSIYQGFLYNEFFSLPMNFGSVWKLQTNETDPNATFSNFAIPGYPGPDGHPTYVFGVDPVWKGSSNELLYYNSVKMKMSVIIGVIQMSVGIFLHLLNALYFKNWIDIFAEFFPRIIFLWCIFGYMCFMIFFKWGTDYVSQDARNVQWKIDNNISDPSVRGPEVGSNGAPVLLNELIFMVLPGGKPDLLYKGQESIQKALIAVAFLMVPIMAFLKPCYIRKFHKKAETDINYELYEDKSKSTDKKEESAADHEDGEDFSEIMVHQLLETIEFVLGSVSHTASYLRLWALSLAHSELSTVFWDKIVFMLIHLTAPNHWIVVALATFAAHSIWFFVTFLVMIFMEGLSAFLHTLRLHWVEFQSKFYKGDGHQFQPFSFNKIE